MPAPRQSGFPTHEGRLSHNILTVEHVLVSLLANGPFFYRSLVVNRLPQQSSRFLPAQLTNLLSFFSSHYSPIFIVSPESRISAKRSSIRTLADLSTELELAAKS